MIVVLSPRAEADLQKHLAYGKRRFGEKVADKTFSRVKSHIFRTLASFPRTARYFAKIDAFESWVPKTPFIVYFRLNESANILTVLAVVHHAQDRAAFDPEADE